MSEENGPIFVELTDDDGNEVILEYVTSLEIGGQEYRVFFRRLSEYNKPCQVHLTEQFSLSSAYSRQISAENLLTKFYRFLFLLCGFLRPHQV